MRLLAATAAILMLTVAGSAPAATVLDPAGDFAPGYLGGARDLDVRSFSVDYDMATQLFSLGATFDDVINPLTAGTYVIGVDTGTGTSAPFASLGAPDVRFNTSFRVNKDGSTTLAGYAATISASGFTITLPASLFTSTGRTPERYGFNLWPRNGVGTGTFVTDFAPNNATLPAVPEPASWMTLLVGFGAMGAALRRHRVRRPAIA